MSSIAERLRARIQENRNATRSSSVPSSNDSSVPSSLSRTSISLYGIGREQAVGNLKLAVAYNIYGRKVTYPDYMRAGLAVFTSLVSPIDVEKWFSRYCIEPYPDVCYCGSVFYGSSNSLRTHCMLCKGVVSNRRIDPYVVQRLAQETGIHYSWIEYAAAWALAHFKAMPLRANTHESNISPNNL